MKYKFEYVILNSSWDKNEDNNGGFTLNWNEESLGFGQLTFFKHNNKTICETEYMSKEFIDAAVKFWLESLIYENK